MSSWKFRSEGHAMLNLHVCEVYRPRSPIGDI
jgi:hypothetical protein